MARQPRVSKRSPPVSGGRRPSQPGSLARSLDFLDGSIVARAAGIPIALWICAAVVAHLAGGGGAMKAAELVHERDELRAAVRFVRDGLRPSDTTFEILTDDAVPTPQQVEPPKDDPAAQAKADESAEKDPDAIKVDPVAKPAPPPKEKDKPKVEPPKPEPPKPEPPKVAQKPEPPKPLVPLAPQPAAPAPPPPPPPPPEMDSRQAVQQHAKKDQPDNPNAQRIADDANTVEKETMARARAQDQDAPKPSMGASKGSAKEEDPGNDKEEHSGSAENHKGDEKHAPGEAAKAATDSIHEKPAPPVPPKEGPPPSAPGMAAKGGRGAAAAPAAPPSSPGGAGPASPEVVSAEKGGGYTLDPANPGGDGKSKRPGKKRAPSPYELPVHVDAMGLGGKGLPGGPPMLTMPGVVAAVGNEQLNRERAADGAARRAAHKGKWEKNKFDKWRPAIENYEPTVKLDNVTALNAARSPFATYLVTIHNRIHPIFAEEYLEFYNSRPKGDKVNDLTIFTSLEIVLEKTTGKIVRMGVTKSSGITEYDITALKSVDRAAPFGKAPDIIASPDGNVYLHWEFHRDPFDACTTRNARPFMLKEAPKKPVAPVGPLRLPGTGSSDDRTPPSGPLVPLRP